MSDRKPFIPRDKPKSWVLLTLTCLSGLGVGVLMFVAYWLELPRVAELLRIVFICCWVVGAICAAGFLVNLVRGKYHNLRSLPWAEQQW
jgi:hypothetical protein